MALLFICTSAKSEKINPFAVVNLLIWYSITTLEHYALETAQFALSLSILTVPQNRRFVCSDSLFLSNLYININTYILLLYYSNHFGTQYILIIIVGLNRLHCILIRCKSLT